MDVVLALAEDLVIDFIWSDELHDEWERSSCVKANAQPEAPGLWPRPFGPISAPASTLPPIGTTSLPRPAPISLNVSTPLRRSVAERASCSRRTGGTFPLSTFHQHGVKLMTADAYLRDLLRRRPSEVTASVRRLAALKSNPPKTPCELVNGLRRAGASGFAERLGIRLGLMIR